MRFNREERSRRDGRDWHAASVRVGGTYNGVGAALSRAGVSGFVRNRSGVVYHCICVRRDWCNSETAQMRYKMALLSMAAGWLEKGVLTEADLMEIQTAIDAQYVVKEPEKIVEAGEQVVS